MLLTIDLTTCPQVIKREEKRPLPIISPPTPGPPDLTKSFGFLSGHIMKIKQRWDQNVGVYLNRADGNLAASPGKSPFENPLVSPTIS